MDNCKIATLGDPHRGLGTGPDPTVVHSVLISLAWESEMTKVVSKVLSD